MAKLPVTSALAHLHPPIILESADEISNGDGHAYSLLAEPPSGKRQPGTGAAGPATPYPRSIAQPK